MFIGREKELALLQQDYIGKAVMVYGKRRVGKTTLIQKALKSSSYRTVYFECLKGTMQDNINGLVRELVRAKLLPVPLNFSTLQDVFAYLNALPEKIIVVIDEYPYLKAMNDSATVDSIFQNIIDNRLANVTTRTKDRTKLVSYIECDTNKSPRQHEVTLGIVVIWRLFTDSEKSSPRKARESPS